MKRRLIINADDLGINAPRSHGIFAAFEHGVVTSATLIVNGSDAAHAAKHAREKKMPVGLHLNFTEGGATADAASVQSLLKANGEFHDRHAFRRLIGEGAIDTMHIEREIRAQVEWFLDNHGAPTHVDGHHHAHVHPVVVPLLIPVLHRYGIPFVRIPSDRDIPQWELDDETLAKARAISDWADAARVLYEANGIGSTDNFRGLTLVGRASAKNLRHILARLPEGSTELMVHPGSMTPTGTDFDRDPQRQTELMMLVDETLRPQLAEKKITLCSYADLH